MVRFLAEHSNARVLCGPMQMMPDFMFAVQTNLWRLAAPHPGFVALVCMVVIDCIGAHAYFYMN